jgi:hypothetical protein
LLNTIFKHIGQKVKVYHIESKTGVQTNIVGVFNIRKGDLFIQLDGDNWFLIDGRFIEYLDYRADQGEYYLEVHMSLDYRIVIDFREW